MGKGYAKRYLFAGPFFGEFGHELFCWQGRLRQLAAKYQKTYVWCPPDHALFYEDFAEVNTVPRGIRGGPYQEEVQVIPPNYQLVHYKPEGKDKARALRQGNFYKQKFVRLGDKDQAPAACVDVIIHARARQHRQGENWPRKQWLKLVEQLRGAGYSVGHIGLADQACDLSKAGSKSFMGLNLRQLCGLLRYRCHLVVGSSSGPMHLASLCERPHLVLTGKRNRSRYRKDWNPFGTAVTLIESWHPPVEAVYDEAVRMLAGD